MSNQIKLLKAALKNNRPALLLGPAGSAKTSTVQKVAAEMEMPVEVLLLAGILPEDLGGLVRPTEDGKAFEYLAPKWATKYGDKPFVLFLDEINQASIQTLHALFYPVDARQVAGIHLPNMRVVAAGNTVDQNEFLTPLPIPLLDRFVYRINWSIDLLASLKYLGDKYKHIGDKCDKLIQAVKKTYTESITPRHVEQMLMMIEDDTDTPEVGIKLVGSAYEVYLNTITAGERHIEDNRLEELKKIAKEIKSPEYYAENGKLVRKDMSKLLNGLTPEELEVVNNAF
jgi:MoxR-like ATPase